jgi:hypothetical protein
MKHIVVNNQADPGLGLWLDLRLEDRRVLVFYVDWACKPSVFHIELGLDFETRNFYVG